MLNLKALALIPALVGVAVIGTGAGWWGASHRYEVRLASLQANHDKERQKTAEARNAELAAALAEQNQLARLANEVGWTLLQTRSQLYTTQQRLQQRITDAIRDDGVRFTGLGPDSLRLYRAAFGYPDRAPGVSATGTGHAAETDQAPGTDEGLPPVDLLEHATEYGQWCQQLDAQLSAYIGLYTAQPQEAQP